MELKTLPQLIEAFTALNARVLALETAAANKRDRGPASEREMMPVDAYRVKFGDFENIKHKAAAESLGISYGQVYSARGGYTFKQVQKTWIDDPKNKAALDAAMKEHPLPGTTPAASTPAAEPQAQQ